MPRIQLALPKNSPNTEWHEFTVEDNYQPIPPPKRQQDKSPRRPDVYQPIPPSLSAGEAQATATPGGLSPGKEGKERESRLRSKEEEKGERKI
jgi:hypothetical protein